MLRERYEETAPISPMEFRLNSQITEDDYIHIYICGYGLSCTRLNYLVIS